jgi:hypothetical protein
MALIHCSSCGTSVSEQAKACPQCGHPIAKRSSAAWMVLAVLLLILFGAITALHNGVIGSHSEGSRNASSNNESTSAPLTRSAFILAHVSADTSCTSFGDYCARTSCEILNAGNDAGIRTIAAAMFDDTSEITVKRTSLTLSPGSRQTGTFDFHEAELGRARHYKFRCRRE